MICMLLHSWDTPEQLCPLCLVCLSSDPYKECSDLFLETATAAIREDTEVTVGQERDLDLYMETYANVLIWS